MGLKKGSPRHLAVSISMAPKSFPFGYQTVRGNDL